MIFCFKMPAFLASNRIKSVHKNKSPITLCKGCERRTCACLDTSASLRSADKHTSCAKKCKKRNPPKPTEAELCAKPLAQPPALTVRHNWCDFHFCSCKRHCFLIAHQLLERGAFFFNRNIYIHHRKIRKYPRKIMNKNCAVASQKCEARYVVYHRF